MDAPAKGLAERGLLKKPASVHAYFDKVQAWVPEPLSSGQLRELERLCGRGGVYCDNRRADFNSHLRQRLELNQPSEQALRLLAQVARAYINRAEFAVDLIFDHWKARDDALSFLHRHAVRHWHGSTQQVRVVGRGGNGDPHQLICGQTRYDAARWVGNRLCIYGEDYSRITGELNCARFEWRANGVQAMRRAGVHSATDLLNFDFRTFFEGHLLLRDIDQRRLALQITNKNHGTRGRGVTQDHDARRLAHILVNLYPTVQGFIDECGSRLRLDRVLVHLPNDDFLPERTSARSIVINAPKPPTRPLSPSATSPDSQSRKVA